MREKDQPCTGGEGGVNRWRFRTARDLWENQKSQTDSLQTSTKEYSMLPSISLGLFHKVPQDRVVKPVRPGPTNREQPRTPCPTASENPRDEPFCFSLVGAIRVAETIEERLFLDIDAPQIRRQENGPAD